MLVEVVHRRILLQILRALLSGIGEQARHSFGDRLLPVLQNCVMDFMPGRDLTERFFFSKHLKHNFCLEFR